MGSRSVIVVKENLQEKVFSVIRPTSKSLPPDLDKTNPEIYHGDKNQGQDKIPSIDTKSESEEQGSMPTVDKVFKETEKSSWLLKIIYNIVGGAELIIKLVQVQQTIRISS